MNQLFYKLRPAIIALETEDKSGRAGMGTGFHVGDGIVVTARHVVEGMRSVRLIAKEAKKGATILATSFSSNPVADVALLLTDLDFSAYMKLSHLQGFTYTKTDHLALGVEWDDFADDSLMLHDVVVAG